ncbi:hypothetical protein SUGI_1115280 [Cryptomeria japonica]|nr:hypothetical protein SUGI_1115280 [Cryptomeria japonica]
MGGIGYILKEWEPIFNPLKMKFKEVPVWIRIYNLPFEYWDMDTLHSIGDKLGTFIRVGEGVEAKDFNMYARIYINWKLVPPLPKEIEF